MGHSIHVRKLISIVILKPLNIIMGNCQTNNYTDVIKRKQKIIYNEALYKTLLQKLKYIEQHNPAYHSDFNTYYSAICNNFDKDLLINHSEISVKYHI